MKRTILPLAALLAFAACSSSKELTCASDQKVCSNACTSVLTDASNCGACGHICGTGQGCSAGACVDCAANPAACTAAVAVACFNTDEVRFAAQDLTQVGPALAVGSGPEGLAEVNGTFYVTNDLASSITPFTLAPLQAANAIPVPATSADLSHVAAYNGLLFASSSAMQTVVVVDPVAGKVVDEVSLAQTAGESVNPQAIAFVGTKGYVALAAAGAVAVLDVSTATAPKVIRRIDVSKYATGTAQAYPSAVLAASGKVYVALNDAFDAAFAPVAGAYGKLVVIDPATDTVVGDTALDLGPDCLDASALALSGTTLWVGCGTFDVRGPGLAPVSIAATTPSAGAVVKTAHAIDALAVCGGRGYAGSTDDGTVLTFDPTTGAVTGSAVICPQGKNGAFVPGLACTR
jgi:stigma-specific protein Stig1